MRPYVGEASDEYRAVCVYSPTPGAEQCGAAATTHVRVLDCGGYGEVCLASCADHAPVARAAGALVAEHAFSGCCGLPATMWLDGLNVCVLDESGVEPNIELAAMVTPP